MPLLPVEALLRIASHESLASWRNLARDQDAVTRAGTYRRIYELVEEARRLARTLESP